jgi:predicted permease
MGTANVWRDARLALRSLCRQPTYALSVTIVLSVVIGTNTVLFSLISGVRQRFGGIAEPDRLVRVLPSRTPTITLGSSDFEYLAREHVFDGLAGFRTRFAFLAGDSNGQNTPGELVTSSYFSVLGVRLLRGRPWTDQDVTLNPRLAVISEPVWEHVFKRAPDAIGQTLSIDGLAFTVIGIAPAAFDGMTAPGVIHTAFWIPVESGRASAAAVQAPVVPETLRVFARLRPGDSLARADQRLTAQDGSATTNGRRWELRNVADSWFEASLDGIAVPMALLVLGAGALVLIIGSTNLSSLMIARVLERRADIGIRVALGADALDVMRPIVLEVGWLSGASSLAGVVLAAAIDHGIAARHVLAFGFAFEFSGRLDWSVYLYTAVLASLAMSAVALGPLMRVLVLLDPVNAGRNARMARRRRIRTALMAAQVAGTFALLLCGVLFGRGWSAAALTDFSVRTSDTVAIAVRPSAPRSAGDGIDAATWSSLADAMRRLPGVIDATVVDHLPAGGEAQSATVLSDATVDGPRVPVRLSRVSVGALQRLGLIVRHGRSFDVRDHSGAPVAIVSRSATARLWPDRSVLGQRFRLALARRTVQEIERDRNRMFEVIGEVNDIGGAERNQAAVYVLLDRDPVNEATIVARLGAPGATLPLKTVAAILREADPRIAVTSVQPLSDILRNANVLYLASVGTTVFSTVGLMAAVLSIVGIAGLIAYVLRQSVRDIAVRIALGGTSSQIVAAVCTGPLCAIAIGAVGGTCLAMLLSLAAIRRLPFIPGGGLWDIAAVTAIVLAGTGLGVAIPLRRALRLAPWEALKSE